jgi:hypothetical protein
MRSVQKMSKKGYLIFTEHTSYPGNNSPSSPAMEYGREFYGPPRPPHMARERQPEAQRPRWQHDQDDVRKEVTTAEEDREIAPGLRCGRRRLRLSL